MGNHQRPADFSSGAFAQRGHFNSNVTGLALVSGQNSHGTAGSEYDADVTGLPFVDYEIMTESAVQPPQYDPNSTELPVDDIPNSPPIITENFLGDTDVATILDQIMGREPSSVFSNFSENSDLQEAPFPNAATAPVFMSPEPSTSFAGNMQQARDYQNVASNQTQTAPIYDVNAQANANRIGGSGQSFSSSNYVFPVNNMMQQPRMYSSEPLPDQQGSAPGSQVSQYSAPPAVFNPQTYTTFMINASTALIKPQAYPDHHQVMNVNPEMPGTSLPHVMSQFNSLNANPWIQQPQVSQLNSPNVNALMPGISMPMTSQFNSINSSPMMPNSSLPNGVTFNPMNTCQMTPGTYTLPVSATNGTIASFSNLGRTVTIGPGISARVELGHNAITSNAAYSSTLESLSGGTSMNLQMHGANSHGKNVQNSEASSTNAGKEVVRHDDSGTRTLVISSQRDPRRRFGTYKQKIYDEPIINTVYDPRYAELGLPVDPFLRMLTQYPDFCFKR